MSHFLKFKLPIAVLLISIVGLLVGASVAIGSGLNAADGSDITSIVADPLLVVVEGCEGTAEFSVYGAGWDDNEAVLLTLTRPSGPAFVGAGFGNENGGFEGSVVGPVTECGVWTVRAKGAGGRVVTTPVVIVESK